MIDETDLNAVVIDVKGDRGLLSSRYDIPLAAEIGALKLPTIKDARAFVADLHQRNIYAIARIVVFKDNILANAKPEWAITDTRTQKPWMDRFGAAGSRAGQDLPRNSPDHRHQVQKVHAHPLDHRRFPGSSS
ncbi:MAG: putative glycoside hydrolase [Terriglobia bacterium]